MNCNLACHLIDDYLENELNSRDRQRLEAHLAQCPRCRRELNRRPVFERSMRRGLAVSVQPLHLSPDVSTRIVEAAQGSLRRAIWSRRVMSTVRGVSSSIAVLLMLVGLYFLVTRSPLPPELQALNLFARDKLPLAELGLVRLLPEKRLALSESHPVTLSTTNQPNARSTAPSSISFSNDDLVIEPWDMEPGQPFTMTLFVHSNLPQPLDRVRMDLDISGPAGYYRFALAVEGPFPHHGVSIVRVTSDLLADPCQDKYLVSPTDIFGSSGVYTVRVTLFNPVLSSDS
jgi:hypothetical protein